MRQNLKNIILFLNYMYVCVFSYIAVCMKGLTTFIYEREK
jgi:hypothetical protein